jgi:hypothetical protein
MQLYKVKLKDGHIVKTDQTVDGYLGEAGELCLYTRGEALKKAIAFGGKIEKHGKNYTTSENKILNLDGGELSPAVKRELKQREVYVDVDEDINEPIYYGDVFATILGEETEKEKLLQNHAASLIDELIVLDNICRYYDYVRVIYLFRK